MTTLAVTDTATALTLYENARRALAEAHRIDEVKDIRDKAVAMEVYAKRAQDRDLIEKAVEIRLHAERRAGELLIEQAERGERETRGGDRRSKSSEATLIPKLADLRITKTESSRWQKMASLGDDAFEVRVTAMKKQALSPSALNKADIRERRAEREARLGAYQAALPDRRYGVIYADPPWKWTAYSSETGLCTAPESHYTTMRPDEIAVLDIASIAADDCVLFLWATRPHLANALEVMTAWGFTYKTCFGWTKMEANGSPRRRGTGYWAIDNLELLLLGTKGEPPCPAQGDQWLASIPAPVVRGSDGRVIHSAKPAIFAEMIESYFPTLPKIELFCRGPARPGWDSWGNESIPAEDVVGALP
jgi:N6-adenosine-specific RNA methylase IME4